MGGEAHSEEVEELGGSGLLDQDELDRRAALAQKQMKANTKCRFKQLKKKIRRVLFVGFVSKSSTYQV